MCGIVGFASGQPIPAELPLIACRDVMAHRGPDDAGLYYSDDRKVAFAHRRLAIIDLSPGGHQPMAEATAQLQITFNGEIYNYRELRDRLRDRGYTFHTASDTEVILAAYREWGTDCVKELSGMFALGIHDRARQRIFIARDRAGEKPLFYRHAPRQFAFASELKALFSDPTIPRQVDLESLEHYLAYGYVPGGRCMLRGFNKLPPGHALTYDIAADRVEQWEYWSLPIELEQRRISDEELVSELEALLEDSVRRQTLASDVPVGVLLSGGIDSSLITAMAARISSVPVKTFTISFPGHGVYDEGPFARTVAEHFGTEHTELEGEEATVDLLPMLARQYDEPMADSSMIPTFMVSRLIRRHCTVALGGDGGDELFGGYGHHAWVQHEEHLRRFIPSPIRKGIGWIGANVVPIGMRGRNRILGIVDSGRSIAHINLYIDAATRRRLVVPKPDPSWITPEDYKASLAPRGQSILRQATYVDFKTYLPDDILTKVDRASMLASLEVRAPFLDPRIIEFAYSRVPDRLRATREEKKILPRMLAAKLLPKTLDLKRKQGFSLPLDAWFKGRFGEVVRDVLSQADPRLFSPKAIESVIKGQQSGRSNTHRLYALTLFELWRREYKVSV